mmetsp:Transcript_36410/g.81025  ORF Transcript_36410/g.81025 Transcript_36410/m.81025 type:complete len:93 (-) Transcript_36410:225-503(-)
MTQSCAVVGYNSPPTQGPAPAVKFKTCSVPLSCAHQLYITSMLVWVCWETSVVVMRHFASCQSAFHQYPLGVQLRPTYVVCTTCAQPGFCVL